MYLLYIVQYMHIFLSLVATTAVAEDVVPIELKVWHSYRDAEKQAFEELLQRYDNANDKIEIQILSIAYDSYVSKLESAIPRDNGPDIFVYAHEKTGSWAESKIIRPVSLVRSPEFHPLTIDSVTYKQELYGYPLAFKCLILFRNTKLLDKAPTTTDELFDLTDTLDPSLIPLAYPATEAFFHMPWLFGFQGQLFDTNGHGTLDHPNNTASLEFLAKLVEKNIIPKEPDSALVTQLFNQGKTPLVINGPWFLSSIDPSVSYTLHPLPIVSETNTPASPLLSVEALFVSNYSKHPEEAEQLAVFLSNTESAIHRAIVGRQTVATMEAYQDRRISEDPILSAFMDQLPQTVPTPNIPEMTAVWEPMARAIRRVHRQAMPPSEALRQAQTEFTLYIRPAPTPANPTPYLVIACIFLVGLLGYLGNNIHRNWTDIKKNASAYLYIAPASIAMLLLTAIPFVVGATVSLFSHHNGEFTFVGLAHFLDILLARDWPITSSMSFYFTLVVTIFWTICNIILHVGLGLGLAMLLREPWLRLRGIYRVMLIIPWAIPNYITALIWKGMFHQQFGAINALLATIGIESISWFSQFSTAFAANLITNTWLGFPFMMVVSLGALQSIPRDLEDAASVDGANGWQRFRYITLPLLKPALLPAVVLGSVWTFNMFNIIYLVSGGEPDSATDILISDAYRWAFSRGNRYGYASAYAVIIFGILVLYSKIGNKIAGSKTI